MSKVSIELDLSVVQEVIHAKVAPAVETILARYDIPALIEKELIAERKAASPHYMLMMMDPAHHLPPYRVIDSVISVEIRKAAESYVKDDRVIAPPLPEKSPLLNEIPIPAHQPVAQVGTQAGIRSVLPDGPRPDGAERPLSDSVPFRPASDASAPPAPPPGLGGADDLLGIPGFLRRTADNGVPA